MKPLAVAVLLLSTAFLGGQAISTNLPSEAPLATLSARVDKAVYKRGEDIHVTLTLRAGPRGAYVSKWSTHSARNAQDPLSGIHIGNESGFAILVLTLAGKNAEPFGRGGSADRWGPPPPPSERFKDEFLFLKPGEEETWHGSADGSPSMPGKYQVVGLYMPDQNQIRDLVRLPEAQGLLIADEVRSAPVIIKIK
jgi:hypothetical protein